MRYAVPGAAVVHEQRLDVTIREHARVFEALCSPRGFLVVEDLAGQSHAFNFACLVALLTTPPAPAEPEDN
ncbi:MAG: hypothetical protein M5U26_29245 [Planctomycetota bacterium]|nr:hypothetical protein [Planctomycetota bacterium]